MSFDEHEAEKIATAWIELHQAPEKSPEWERLLWAFDRVSDMVQDDPEMAWKIIEAIRQQDGSDHVLSNLAAGPLEDLLVAHGEQFIVRIEAKAEVDPQLRKMLGATWKNDMPDELWERIQAVASASW
jgi:hypothetical protein